MEIVNKIRRVSTYFLSKNLVSILLVIFQAIIFGIFLQILLFHDLNITFFSYRFIIIFGGSVLGFCLFWAIYALIISRLFLGRFSRGAISKILNYDAYSYFPLTILMLAGLVFYFTQVITNLLSWFFFIGIVLVALSKILLFIYKPPDKEISLREVGWQTKQKIIKNVTNLNADEHVARMYKIDGEHVVRKYMVNDELRNSINLKNSKSGKLTFNSTSPIKTLYYSVGKNAENSNLRGNLKLYLCNDKTDEMIFNKDASNIFHGWNEYHIMLPKESKTVEIRWENSIESDVFLSISNLSPEVHKDKRKNIIVMVFDGLHPETIGLYNGRYDADNISKFFKNSLVKTNAYSQGDWTMPNIMSIATSRYLSHHGLFDPDLYSRVLPDELTTLAEVLQKNGYNTFGYFGCHRTSPGYGHVRGYNSSIYRYTGKKAGYNNMDITISALNFLKKNKKTNNFLFLHYYGTHPNYFQNPSNISSKNDSIFNMDVNEAIHKNKLNDDDYLFLKEIYLQKYNEIDNNLPILFDYISKYENDNTTIILTSDHGTILFDENSENMLPAGKDARDIYLKEPRIKIPFMIRFPDDKNRNRDVGNEFIEGNISVMPTVLEIAGVQPPEDISGISVLRKDKNKERKSKDYTLSESIYKEVYELLLKCYDFTYFLRTGRNQETSEILKDPGLEKFYDSNGKIITSKETINKLRKRVKQILKENNLSNVVTDKE